MPKTEKETDKLELTFNEDRATKRTVLFQEQLGDVEYSSSSFAIGPLYIQKEALRMIGDPHKVKVTIEPLEG